MLQNVRQQPDQVMILFLLEVLPQAWLFRFWLDFTAFNLTNRLPIFPLTIFNEMVILLLAKSIWKIP